MVRTDDLQMLECYPGEELDNHIMRLIGVDGEVKNPERSHN